MSYRSILIIIIVIIVLLIGGSYWYFFLMPSGQVSLAPGNQTTSSGFAPYDRDTTGGQGGQTGNTLPATTTGNTAIGTSTTSNAPLPSLRQLSVTPVGGYGIDTSKPPRAGKIGTTTIRWVDRGRGNIYETLANKGDVTTLSNTLVPRIYESWWNKGLSTFIATYTSESSDTLTTVVANLIKNSTTTAPKTASSTTISQTATVSETPFKLKGSMISNSVIDVAVSPTMDKVLIVTKEKNRSIGRISRFDGSGQTIIFDIPLTQITVDWPEANTIVITTNGSASYDGYLYFVNVKTGTMKAVLENIKGLSGKVSRDASKIIYSSTGTGNTAIDTYMYDVKTGKATDVIFKTLAEKCVWGSKSSEFVYCAVPSQIPEGIYPDIWYLGGVEMNDNIWSLNTKTGNARQIANLLNLGNSLINVYDMRLDENDNYLVFMNKNNLSLWLLDLISIH